MKLDGERPKIGETLREQLQGLADREGVVDDRLFADEVSMGAEHLFRTFWCIKRSCRGGSFGGGGLSYPDIESYMRLSGAILLPWEVEALIEMDLAHASTAEKQRKKYGKKGSDKS